MKRDIPLENDLYVDVVITLFKYIVHYHNKNRKKYTIEDTFAYEDAWRYNLNNLLDGKTSKVKLVFSKCHAIYVDISISTIHDQPCLFLRVNTSHKNVLIEKFVKMRLSQHNKEYRDIFHSLKVKRQIVSLTRFMGGLLNVHLISGDMFLISIPTCEAFFAQYFQK